MSDAPLQFWKDYLLQTRKEIDLEKTEGTRILHIKILLIGALLVLVRGSAGVVASLLLPIVMLALDRMQLSRLHYILHRWEYLGIVVIPRLRAALGDQEAKFFEETVLERNREGFYLRLEAQVRTLLFVPALVASAIGASLLAASVSPRSLSVVYLTGIVWMTILTSIALMKRDVYRRVPVVILAALTGFAFILDWTAGEGACMSKLAILLKGAT